MSLKQHALVSEKMTTPVVSISPDATVDEAIEQMLTHHISGIPVVDDDGRLLGVVTEYDLLRLTCLGKTGDDPYLICRNFMTSSIVTIQSVDTMADAASLLLDSQIGRLMVLDGERLAGILSRREVVRYVRDRRMTQKFLMDINHPLAPTVA